ncbi:MAG: hypothetical protein KF718_21065 [Polyangiaceae bacterium]|nr:hypothetical protein [Polyangiaceae bacterium]
MAQLALRPSTLPEGDAYSDLLDRTRSLAHEQRTLRDQWFQGLALDGKEEALFELEVLLKASACFSNPRNQPGQLRRTPTVALDFRQPTVLFRDGLHRALGLSRQLLGTRDRRLVFHRYLETVLPEDNLRTRLAQEGTAQQTPEDSLVALRQSLTSTVEVVEGVLRGQRVPFRLFYAVLGTVQREVNHNTFFNPLTALEFRPEFDRIRSGQVLDLIRSVPGQHAHRLVALTFLALFRMLRYVRLLGRIAVDVGGRRRRAAGRAYLVLSVLRSDARALSDYLRRRSGLLLAQGYEQDLLRTPASRLLEQSSHLRASGHRLLGIKSALEGIAGSLRLEVRRVFQHDLPSPEGMLGDAELHAALLTASSSLRPALRNAILFLGKALGVALEEDGVFDDHAAARETSERLRRDVWMFAQIVRAFATKAQYSPAEDRWAPVYNFQYVREFLSYFRAMGYPLLRATDYPRFDAFIRAMTRLQDTDLVDPNRLEEAIDECVAFHSFLMQLFEDISRRDALADVPFDRRAAAGALKLYISDN